eukprot:TRINITY_DN1121_c1_g2_i1.p1 TRINITY_DN1121_c1_g2~~TRINITY_DN1121_c1_g2_i1.p1  ORF type:complete len:816 (+),score=48.33 TRINITY_DN1121_c1_g2_i1:436-2883(+)
MSSSTRGTGRCSSRGATTVRCVYNAGSMSFVTALSDHTAAVKALAFSRDGSKLATGSEDNRVYVYDTTNWAQLSLLMECTAWVSSLDFSPDGNWLVAGCDDSNARLYDGTTLAFQFAISESAPVKAAVFSEQSALLALGKLDGTVSVFQILPFRNTPWVPSFTSVTSTIGPPSVSDLAFDPSQNDILVAACTNGAFYVYDLRCDMSTYQVGFPECRDTPAPATPAPTPAPTPVPSTPAPTPLVVPPLATMIPHATMFPVSFAPQSTAAQTSSPWTSVPLQTAYPSSPSSAISSATTNASSTTPAHGTPSASTGTTTALPAGVNEGTTAGAADEDEVYEFDILYKVALATAVASAPTGYAMPSALRFVIASRSCESQQPGMNYSRVLHPTQLTLSGSNELGMVAGNAALLLVVTLLCALLLWLLQTAGPKCLPEWLADEDMQGYLRLPSGPLTALQFLYQGLILGSAKLVLQGPASYIAYGAAGVGFCVLAPVMVVRKVPGSASSPRDKCRYFLDATMPPAPGRFTKAWAYLCICGPGDYVNTHRSVAWVSRYNVAIRQFTPGCLYWMAVDFTYTLFIAALHGPGIYGHHLVQCAYQKLFTGLASLLMFAVYVRQRPFNKTRDLYAEGGASLLQGVAYLCMATGYFLGDVRHVSFSIAAWLLVSALGLIVAKAACDVIWAALSFSRVARLQEAYDAAAKDRLRVEDMVAIDTSSPTLTRSQGGGVSAKSVTSASCRIPSDTNTMMSKTMPSLSDADAIPTTPMLGRGSRATFKAGSPRRLPLGVSGLKPYDCDGSPFITPKSPASPVSRLVPQQMI